MSGSATTQATPPYFRRDQEKGVSPPDLSKVCTFAEHIVHARGKRSQYTSVSLDLARIQDFGEAAYQLNCKKTVDDGHALIEHSPLILELQRAVREGEKAERLKSIQAVRYAKKRKEGLVRWRFAIPKVARKDLITWAHGKVQAYFVKV